MGVPINDLSSMTERSLRLYQAYGEQRGFPSRRIELYLAQLAMLIAQTMGGAKNVKLADFLFEPQKESADDLDALKQEIGFSPRKRK